jgi:hypothetical protein
MIDGAYPTTMFDEAGAQKVRKQFRHTQILNKDSDTVVAAIEDVIHEPVSGTR